VRAFLKQLANEFVQELRVVRRLMYTGVFLGLGMFTGIAAAWSFFDWAHSLL
jgi:hypothetical protein